MSIEKLAEELYPIPEKHDGLTEKGEHAYFTLKAINLFEKQAFIAGYQTCETRSKKLVEALKEIDRIMKLPYPEYHHAEIALLAKQALSDWEGENK